MLHHQQSSGMMRSQDTCYLHLLERVGWRNPGNLCSLLDTSLWHLWKSAQSFTLCVRLGVVFVSSRVGEAKVICSRMLSAVCSALHKILIRHVPILKEPRPLSSIRSFPSPFYLLFALTQLSGCRLYYAPFFICLQWLIPVPTSNAIQFHQILAVWNYCSVKSRDFTKCNSWICFTSNGITQTGATEYQCLVIVLLMKSSVNSGAQKSVPWKNNTSLVYCT